MNRFIDSPPEGSAGWERVWRDDLRYPPDQSSSLIHRIVRAFVSPLVRRASRAEQERQRNFNVALLEMFRDSRAEVSALHRDLAAVHEDLLKEIRNIQQLLPIAVQRNDALVAAVDQKLESVASRLRGLSATRPRVRVPSPSVDSGDVGERLLDRLDPANQLDKLARFLWRRDRLAALRGIRMYFFTDIKGLGNGLAGVNIHTGRTDVRLRLSDPDERFITDETTRLLYVSKGERLLAYKMSGE